MSIAALPPDAPRHPPRQRATGAAVLHWLGWTPWRRAGAGAWLLVCALVLALVGTPAAGLAQGVEPISLSLERRDGAITLDYSLRVELSRPVDDALHRGVPLYFVAEAVVFRSRWYWRDERTARAARSWRLTFQPLTGNYRVSLGALHQTYATLNEAMLAMTRLSQWRIAGASVVEPDESYYVEFNWRLDTAQLPRPMQIGIGSQVDWVLEFDRTLQLEP